jgi:hypothetical protein
MHLFCQDHCNHRGIFNHCFPEREIPKWFCRQNKGNSVTTDIPQNLFSDRNWMGFAICAVFPFHKHETAVRNNLESGIPHRVICQLQTDIAGMSPISTPYSISEDEVLISLYQRAFLWLSFTPSGNWMGSRYWNQMSWAKFSFVSDTPDVSSAVKCGINLVYRHNLDEFTRTIVQLITSYVDYMHLIRNSSKKNEPTVYKRLPMYHDEEVSRPDRSYEVPIQYVPLGLRTPKPMKPFFKTGPLVRILIMSHTLTPTIMSLSLSDWMLYIFLCYRTLIRFSYIIFASLQVKQPKSGSVIRVVGTQ